MIATDSAGMLGASPRHSQDMAVQQWHTSPLGLLMLVRFLPSSEDSPTNTSCSLSLQGPASRTRVIDSIEDN